MLIETLHCIGATVIAIENLSKEYDVDKLQVELPSLIEGIKPIVIESDNVFATLCGRR